jgi:uncharacterized repeat protein (TIGR01451 family)
MREVLTATGCTPVSGASYSVNEWCINAGAVNPATHSVFMPNEDGRIYRWDVVSNSLSETLVLEMAVAEGYVPTFIGPDGTIYTIGNTTLFACGGLSNVAVNVSSSMPDLRHTVAGQAVTFTASVSNPDPSGPVPTGGVTFTDLTYRGTIVTNRTLAANMPLSNGVASVTVTNLSAGTNASGNYLGNHFITAVYSGDANFSTGSVSLVQKVHAGGTTTSLTSSMPPPGGKTVLFTVRVAPQPPFTTVPTGMVTFWDGTNVLGQLPLTSGRVVFSNANFTAAGHAFSASYSSDTVCADSSGNLLGTPPRLGLGIDPATGGVLLTFTNGSASPFTVWSAPDVGTPATNWDLLGVPTEFPLGHYQFLDPAGADEPARFYRVTSP